MPEPLTTTSYDANNRQITFGNKTLAYDDNGNLQSITDSNGTTLYSWNARNQLVAINGPSVNASFVYDGAGRREAKTVKGSLTEFLYDRLNPVQETAGATILANILPGLGIDEFLTRTDVLAGETRSFLTDALGSSVALADNAGVVQTDFSYEAFGKTTTTGASDSSSYQYTGRENDLTGLHFYRARYYHPTFQRFIAEDPIGFNGGDENLYGYVRNRPTLSGDPLGLIPPIAIPLICVVQPELCIGVGAVTVGVIIHYLNNPIKMSPPTDGGGGNGGSHKPDRWEVCWNALTRCILDLKCDPVQQSLCWLAHEACVKYPDKLIQFPNGTVVGPM